MWRTTELQQSRSHFSPHLSFPKGHNFLTTLVMQQESSSLSSLFSATEKFTTDVDSLPSVLTEMMQDSASTKSITAFDVVEDKSCFTSQKHALLSTLPHCADLVLGRTGADLSTLASLSKCSLSVFTALTNSTLASDEQSDSIDSLPISSNSF